MNVNGDSSSITIEGLDENLNYAIQVSASTSAGNGIISSSQVAKTIQVPRDNTGAIIGGVVAVVLIVTMTLIIIAVSAMILRSKDGSKKTQTK